MKSTSTMRASLFICYFSVFIDMLGVSIILPIIPFLAEEFDASSQELGWIYAAYAIAQMLGIYASGRLSDRFGRRKLLLLSLFGTCAGFIFQGFANSIALFIAARFTAGIFGGSIPIADSFIGTYVPLRDRPRYYGMLTTMTTVAFMIGPGVGAGLAEFTLRTPMFVSSALACLGFFFAFVYFTDNFVPADGSAATPGAKAPTDVQPQKAVDTTDVQLHTASKPATATAKEDDNEEKDDNFQSTGEKETPDEPSSPQYRVLVRLLWLTSFLGMWSFSAYIYFFGIYMAKVFGWGALEYGFASMGVSIMSVIIQLTAFPWLAAKIGKHATACLGLFMLGLGNVVLTFAGGEFSGPLGWPIMVVSLFLISFGYSCTMPAITTILSRYAPSNGVGVVLGTSKSLQGLARAVGPITFGVLFDVDHDLPFWLAAACAFLASLTVYIALRINRRLPEKHSLIMETGESVPLTHGTPLSTTAHIEYSEILKLDTDHLDAPHLRKLIKGLRQLVLEQDMELSDLRASHDQDQGVGFVLDVQIAEVNCNATGAGVRRRRAASEHGGSHQAFTRERGVST